MVRRHGHGTIFRRSSDGRIIGARGELLAPEPLPRGVSSTREAIGAFEFSAGAVIVASGGIGGNHDLVRKNWPAHLPPAPAKMLSGVPAHVDGLMLGIAERAGARLTNTDRMWHYTEGITNHSPVWPRHGIRILPGPSSLWLDATGRRMPPPALPGFDTLGTLEQILQTGHDHSWFVLTQRIIEKEFALSGSEQNPDLTGKSVAELLKQRLGKGAPGPVQAFIDRGVDFVHANDLDTLIGKMRALSDAPLDPEAVRRAAFPDTAGNIVELKRFASSLDDIVARRTEFLTGYQNAAYAQRYADLVERVRRVESDRVQSSRVTEAVARNYFKLLACKDEYEVARLHADPSFRARIASQFEGSYRLNFHLAPPLLAKPDPRTGKAKKVTFGPWMLTAFGVLAKLKFLRGTAFDLFGYTAERRSERALIGEYEALVDELLARLATDNHGVALQLAGLPDEIRGYGHVKAESLAKARIRWSELLARFRGQTSAQVIRMPQRAA